MPQAELQELLPAGRLLSSATRLSPEQYEQAKTAFLHQVGQAGLAAQASPKPILCFCLCSGAATAPSCIKPRLCTGKEASVLTAAVCICRPEGSCDQAG